MSSLCALISSEGDKASGYNMNNAETAPGVPLVQAVIYVPLTCAQGFKKVSGKCQALV